MSKYFTFQPLFCLNNINASEVNFSSIYFSDIHVQIYFYKWHFNFALAGSVNQGVDARKAGDVVQNLRHGRRRQHWVRLLDKWWLHDISRALAFVALFILLGVLTDCTIAERTIVVEDVAFLTFFTLQNNFEPLYTHTLDLSFFSALKLLVAETN